MIDVTLADGFLTVVHGTVVDIHVCITIRFCNSSGESLTTPF